MRIEDLPADQRPREKLRFDGATQLNDCELLALVLRQGMAASSALDLGYALLAHFGSIRALSRASTSELCSVPGVGEAKSTALVAAFELTRRIGQKESRAVVSPLDVRNLVKDAIGNLSREQLVLVVCDAQDRHMRTVTIAHGALDHTLLPIREILNEVLKHDGRAFALAHNHPSGDVTPSSSDISATKRLRVASGVVGVRMLDHVIVAGGLWSVVS